MGEVKKIPVFDIALGKKEKEYIKDCLDTSFIGQGKYVKTLKKNLVTLLTVNMELQLQAAPQLYMATLL